MNASTISVAILFFLQQAFLSANCLIERQVLIVGLGRVGTQVTKQCPFPSIGTIRSNGVDCSDNTILFSDHAALKKVAEKSSHVLLTIPAPEDEETWSGIHELAASIPSNSWVGLISTTGVYGDHDGAVVTEDSESKCQRTTSAGRLLDFENYWRERHAFCLRIFRCAGIYGGGQSALHTVYKQGFAADSDHGENKTNRVHVEDLAAAVVASMSQEGSCAQYPVRIYNLADNLPESRQKVLSYARDLLESIGIVVQAVDGTKQTPSERTSRRLSERKLIDNRRMRTELCELKFPTYKEGLQHILHDQSSPWWQLI
jgi:hypothetical protein